MHQHEKINYLEYPASDMEATKAFFKDVFNWHFTDYGDSYTAFSNQGLDGGFYKVEQGFVVPKGGALTIFFSDNLQATQSRITAAGGKISQPVFDFPGGRRFHFIEPSGNEMAVWSDKLT